MAPLLHLKEQGENMKNFKLVLFSILFSSYAMAITIPKEDPIAELACDNGLSSVSIYKNLANEILEKVGSFNNLSCNAIKIIQVYDNNQRAFQDKTDSYKLQLELYEDEDFEQFYFSESKNELKNKVKDFQTYTNRISTNKSKLINIMSRSVDFNKYAFDQALKWEFGSCISENIASAIATLKENIDFSTDCFYKKAKISVLQFQRNLLHNNK